MKIGIRENQTKNMRIKIKHIYHKVLIQLENVLLSVDCNYYSDLMNAPIVQFNLIQFYVVRTVYSMYCAGVPFIVSHMKNKNKIEIKIFYNIFKKSI